MRDTRRADWGHLTKDYFIRKGVGTKMKIRLRGWGSPAEGVNRKDALGKSSGGM